jgi:thiol-disulfide isomerase/thioredoxin
MRGARRTQRKAKPAKKAKTQKVKTARGHVHSTAGRIFPPIDIRHPRDINELIKRLSSGPMTIILIYADWCPHCHDFMPHFDEASNQSGRTAQVVKIRDDMVEKVNEMLKRLNKLEHTIEATGYPTVKAMSPEVVTPEVNNGKENVIIDIETKPELVKESMKIAEPNAANANFVVAKTKSKEKFGEADEMVELHDMASRGAAPSRKEPESEEPLTNASEEAKGAEELGVTRPNQKRDMNQMEPGVRGGSLIGAMSQTAYTLAPTAVLLATAKAMFNRKRTRKAKKSIRKLFRGVTARR